MNFLKQAYKTIESKVIERADDSLIRIEGAKRSTGSQKTISQTIKRVSKLFTPKTIKDWKNAIAIATDSENPSLLLLSELQDHLLLDSHTVSVIESRVLRVLRSRYTFINQSGDQNTDLKKMFQRPWFEKFVIESLWSKFTGIKVLELFETDENGELLDITSIPMAHIDPKRGLILEEAGGEKGVSYREGSLETYYAQIGNSQDLGILSEIATLILAKKQAMGAWLDYIEKYGIPARTVTTENRDVKRVDELLDMLVNMINSHVAVLQGNEKFEMSQMPQTDAFKVFKEMLTFLNSEISKRILGQDGTTDNKSASGTYGSLKVLQEVADDRHESDKLFIQYIINKVLIPKLIKINSFYSPLNGYEFDWDETDEMTKKEIIESSVALTQAGYQLDYKHLAEKTGLPIIGFNSISIPLSNEDTKKKSLANK